MGRTLHSLTEDEDDLLSEKDILHLAYRIVSVLEPFVLVHHINPTNLPMSFTLQLDVLQYMHSNEYVHADVNGENIYIQQGQKSLVRNIPSSAPPPRLRGW